MSNNSVDDMLEWLQVEPRTRGWNAILAFDRAKTNTVLLQEYIERFSTGAYMKPITELIKDNETSTHREYIVDYMMDCPRLSFINSKLENSWARLRMKVIGGSHLTLERPTGGAAWMVTKVALEGPLDGPTLLFDIDLKATQATVDRQGTVALNLAEGQNYRLTYTESEQLRRLAGERFKTRFSQLPELQKKYVLNELTIDKDQLIKPKHFDVRTHNKLDSGATLRADEDNEEGSILLFVTAEGGQDGSLPQKNSDLRYLLPEGHSATLLLGHKFFYEKVLIDGLKVISNVAGLIYDLQMEPGNEVIRSVRVRSGRRRVSKEYRRTIEGVSYVCSGMNADIPGGGASDFMNVAKAFKPGHPSGLVFFYWETIGQSEPLTVLGETYSVPTTWKAMAYFRLAIDPESLNIVLLPASDEGGGGIPTVDLSRIPMPAHHRELMLREYERWMEDFIMGMVEEYSIPIQNINVLMLNSLLFRNKNSVRPQSAHFSHDLAIFGHVGPTLTTFTLNNLEPVIGRTDTFEFSTVPAVNNVTWRVQNIPGSTGNPGTINATTGRYTAPNAGQFEGDHIRVRVTATAGGHTSSALVTVLRYDIAINPLVQVVGAGDTGGREVSAGALGNDVLQWSIADPSSGAVVVPSSKEEGDHTYYPGPPVRDEVFSLDRIVVTNPRTQKHETATVLVLHEQASLTVSIDHTAGLPQNKVQLKAYFGNTPVSPDEDLTWTLLAGSGQVDRLTGVYTVNPMGLEKFAIVVAHIPPLRPGRPPDGGFILLPIPLFSVPEVMQMLSMDDEPVTAH